MTVGPHKLGRLQKVDLREIWASEAGDFTPWLALEENIAVLGDTIALDLEVEAQEKEVGPFRADILCKDTASGNWVLIENQLERTDHSHLGQLLTYASGLNAVTIVWVAQRFTDEHRAAFDWLNEITSDDVNFFGLEIELWRIGDSQTAPKFNIVSKPNDWTRSVSGAAHRLKDAELSETKKLQLEYWTEFHKRLAEKAAFIRGTKPRPQHWNDFSIGRSEFGLMTFANTRDRRIGVILICRGEQAKPHFHLLREQKDEIEQQLGIPLQWREMPDKKESHITLRRPDTAPADRDQWPEQHAWMAEKLEAFHRTFHQRVRHLDAADYAPPTDED